MPLYLDFNATSPVDRRVLQAMIHVYEDEYGNAGSRTHRFGQSANALVAKARGQVAKLLGVDKAEVVFTSGATESDNLAILGLAKWGAEHGRKHIISTQIEHKAVLEPLAELAKQGFEIELLPVGRNGRIDPDEVGRRLRPDTLLVTMMHVNNETGVIQPVEAVGELLSGTPTYFHIDAAQSCGKLVPELLRTRYDLLSVSAHKMYGPQGVGALVLRRREFRRPPVQPLMYGGGQEGGVRPGTLPVALCVGFGLAAELAAKEWEGRMAAAKSVKEGILRQLSAVPHLVNGDPAFTLPTTLNVTFPGVDSEALMLMLQEQLAISNGSACTSAEYKPSHVLVAMELSRAEIESAVRISWGPGTPQQVDLSGLVEMVRLQAD